MPGGRSVVSLSTTDRVRVWDILTGNAKALRGDSTRRDSLMLSRDGRWLAIRKFGDWSIKVYDIEQSLKTSKLLEDTKSEQLELQMYQEIETSAPVSWFDISTDSAYLATNCGVYMVGGTAIERSSQQVDASQFLYVFDQWIKYGQTPVLRIPPDLPVARYNVNGDQVAIRFYGGEILILSIDRRALLSAANT